MKDLGATAITITHDMTSVREIADGVAMIYGGKIRWEGPIAEMDTASDPYLSQFIRGRAEGPDRIGALDPPHARRGQRARHG